MHQNMQKGWGSTSGYTPEIGNTYHWEEIVSQFGCGLLKMEVKGEEDTPVEHTYITEEYVMFVPHFS